MSGTQDPSRDPRGASSNDRSPSAHAESEALAQSGIDRLLTRITLGVAARPFLTLALGFLVMASGVVYATGLELKSNFVHLLPSDDPTAQRFRGALDRMGGGSSTLIVLVESPDVEANRAFVDAVTEDLKALPKDLARTVEKGPEEARAFFEKWKWLFAEKQDLARVECELDRAHKSMSPFYFDLDEPCKKLFPLASEARAESDSGEKAGGASGDTKAKGPKGKGALAWLKDEVQRRVQEVDRFPNGYFENEDGSLFAIVVRSPSGGTGGRKEDKLYREVTKVVESHRATLTTADMKIGYGGAIPTAISEREALISDVTTVSFIAVALILGVIVIFFRSPFALMHIGFSVFTGTALAFAIAMAAFGHLNSATSFLGSIIAGNGINYAIVYLARYRERRRGGATLEDALVDAATTCRRGTWLAAVAAGGAYAALMVTSFRGFSQFGLIGGSGMVLCWLSTFVICPASIAAVDRLAGRWFPGRAPGFGQAQDPNRRTVSAVAASLSERFPRGLLVGAMALSVVAAIPLASFLADPWEYNFANLGSKRSKADGAGRWNRKVNDLFQQRGAPTLVLADDPQQSKDIADEILAVNARVEDGKYIEKVETIYDRLGGTEAQAAEKLALLEKVRRHIDKLAPHMEGEDAEAAQELRPPEYLRALTAEDLPRLVREQFVEKDGTVGTPIYVSLSREVSQSRGENLLKITEIFEQVKLPDGRIVPNASRATVFSAMIRSLERDGPRATLLAFLVVLFAAVLVTRAWLPAVAVMGSLIIGVLWTIGGVAWLDVRLNFLNFVALPLTFGIGVEYAINLYERVRISDSISEGVKSAGGPVALCSLTTILGYGSLIFADNRALNSFGTIAIAGEFACIVTAMLVMPAALRLRRKVA